MPQGNKKVKGQKQPTTWDAEYDAVGKTVEQVSSVIDSFLSTYKPPGYQIDYTACTDCLKQVYTNLHIEDDSVQTCDDFIEVVKTRRINKDIKRHGGFNDLGNICNCSRAFEDVVLKCRRKLAASLRYHVLKYFVTLSEFSSMKLDVLNDMDVKYDDYKTKLESKLQDLNDKLTSYERIKTPFSTLVHEGDKFEEIVDSTCLDFGDIFTIMMEWMNTDKEYPQQLFAEMQKNRARTRRMVRDVKRLEQKREGHEAFLIRRRRARVFIDAGYDECRREKQRLATSTVTVRSLIDRTNDDIVDKQKEVESSGNTSPRGSETGSSNTSLAQYDLAKLRDRLAFLKRQQRRTNFDFKDVSDRTYEQKMDVHTNDQQQTDTLAKIDKCTRDITALREGMEEVRRESEAIAGVRDMKLSNDTLRRIHGGTLGTSKPEKAVDKACHFISENIGYDWKRLYRRLPFYPPREDDKRSHDVDIISQVAAKHDQTLNTQARFSLDKWRSFSRHGNVGQLLRSLRLIELGDLARQVERRFGEGRDA